MGEQVKHNKDLIMLTTCMKTDNLPLTIMGLCPLLLVSTSALNAVVMGGIFLTVLLFSSLIISAMRQLIPQVMRLPIILLVTVFIATLIDTLISTFYYEWHLLLGIYVPLLAMNCLILVNIEENVLRNGLKDIIAQTLILGLSIVGILFLVGLVREIMSGLIFGNNGFILFEMAPGAFLVLGFIVAVVNYINTRMTA